jgi:predicted O-methyltransferase YrrM
MTSRNILNLFDEAVQTFGSETKDLEFIPLTRYDVSLFPTVGQYEWLSGQLLYMLIRQIKPVRVIEVSTSSGYSGLFSALALKQNGSGRLETFELIPKVAQAAQRNFDRAGVSDFVCIHIGDAHKTIVQIEADRKTRPGCEVLFLDSEHTAEFAEFYLDALLSTAQDDSIFHMHDILPLDAQVTFRPGDLDQTIEIKLRYFLYRVLRRMTLRKLPLIEPRKLVKPIDFDVTMSTEACLGNQLSDAIPGQEQLFVHHIIDRYPQLTPHRFDSESVWRCDRNGKPMEWNDSWWVYCGSLKKAYQNIS